MPIDYNDINKKLTDLNVKLCPECFIPQSHKRLCQDCNLRLGIVNPLM